MSSPVEGAQSGATGAPSGTGPGTDGITGAEPTGQPAGAPSGTEQGQQSAGEDKVSRADFETLRRQLQAADQNRSKAEQELKQLKDAALSETERTKQHLAEAQSKIQQLEADLKAEKINNAFVVDNTYTWHDPRAALKLADLTNVTVAEDGTVTGLKPALEAVAKANPWMIKPKEGEAPKEPTGATGVAGGAGKGTTGQQTNLESRFPALRGRVKTT